MKTIKIFNNGKTTVAYDDSGEAFETYKPKKNDLKCTIKSWMDDISKRYPGYEIQYSEIMQVGNIQEEINMEGSPKVHDAEVISKSKKLNFLDKYAQDLLNRRLSVEDRKKLRKVTGALAVVNYGISGTVGYLFGKTILTGVALAVGTSIAIEVISYKPKKYLYEKVIK